MQSDWKNVTVEKLAARVAMGPFGSDIKTDNFVPVGVPVIRGNNLTSGRFNAAEFAYLTELKADELKNANAFPGDLVFTHRGTLGQIGIIPPSPFPRHVVSQSQMLLSCDRAVADPLFLFYFFKSPDGQHQLLANTSQTGVPAISRPVTSLKAIHVPLPPLPEQQAIAAVLGALDDKVELNRRMNETLEALARALFQSWFVNFDPVLVKATRAKTRDRFLHTGIACDPYLDTVGLFPDSFQDSALGQIPKGWEGKRLSELCTLGRGASPRPINDYMNGEVPWIKIADATAAGGPFLFQTKEKVKRAGAEKSVPVSPGDLILSNSATCGVPMFVELHGCIHDGWLYFKNLRAISKLYLFHVLIELAEHLIQIADGSVQKNLNTSLVGQQNVLVPPQGVVDAFDKQATTWFAKMRQNGLESRTLAALRDALLPKLLSGELRVPAAAKLVEATV